MSKYQRIQKYKKLFSRDFKSTELSTTDNFHFRLRNFGYIILALRTLGRQSLYSTITIIVFDNKNAIYYVFLGS